MSERLTDPILALSLEFWEKKKGDKVLPDRNDFDPLNIPAPLFPYLILAEVLSDSGLVRYRLVGNEMHSRWGENFTGRTSADIFSGSYREYLESAFALCIAKRLPIFTASRFRWDQGGFLSTQRVMLPIAEASGNGSLPADGDAPPHSSGAPDSSDAPDKSETVAQILVVQTWPNENEDRRTDPMVITPGTSPAQNEPIQVLTPA
jgi:hypothetical protein